MWPQISNDCKERDLNSIVLHQRGPQKHNRVLTCIFFNAASCSLRLLHGCPSKPSGDLLLFGSPSQCWMLRPRFQPHEGVTKLRPNPQPSVLGIYRARLVPTSGQEPNDLGHPKEAEH